MSLPKVHDLGELNRNPQEQNRSFHITIINFIQQHMQHKESTKRAETSITTPHSNVQTPQPQTLISPNIAKFSVKSKSLQTQGPN